MKRTNTSQGAIGRALGVSQPSVAAWLDESRPDLHNRMGLERITNGDVPAADWMTKAELRVATGGKAA